MEKRILLALALSFAVMFAFRWFSPPEPSPETSEVTEAVQSVPATTPAPAPAVSQANLAAQSVPGVTETEVQGDSAETVTVDNALYRASISTAGAVLQSYKLKAYTDAMGQPIELINDESGKAVGFPLALSTGDPAIDDVLSQVNFVATQNGNELSLEYAAGGLRAVKLVQFNPENYEFSLKSTITRNGQPVRHSVVWQAGFGDQSLPYDPTKEHVVYQSGSAFTRLNVSSVEEPQDFNVSMAGIEDQYFVAVAFSQQSTEPVKVVREEFMASDARTVPVANVAVVMPDDGLRFYVGPKAQPQLRAADPRLAALIDYGFFGFIVRPLVVALLWIHNYVGNFGWAIILLTVFINLVLFPLRLKQQVSMQKMQKIQPQMKALQDKYKKLKANDPKRAQVQAEMMELYKVHGVNPMGGCLPLLLQLPFLWAFYSMLSVSIELRQAPWLLWIHDLSRADTSHIMPILMAVSMIVMQKLTPTTVDPAQARIMMIMPIMFTALFWSAQSGLLLYWLTSNVVGIGQQIFMNKYWTPREAIGNAPQRKKGSGSD